MSATATGFVVAPHALPAPASMSAGACADVDALVLRIFPGPAESGYVADMLEIIAYAHREILCPVGIEWLVETFGPLIAILP